MTVTLDIITEGYREGNLIGINVTPTDPEQAQGLGLLQRVVSSVYGFEVGEKLFDWPIGRTNYMDGYGPWSEQVWSRPVANVRIVASASTPQRLLLPREVSDGARIGFVNPAANIDTYPITLVGNGRTIEGEQTLVLDDPTTIADWIYRADLADWVRITDIALDSDFPFPKEFDDAFITLLAMRLNPRYGRAMSGESGAWLTRSVAKLKSRYHQRIVTPADLGVLIMSVQAYSPYMGFDGQPYGQYGWMN